MNIFCFVFYNLYKYYILNGKRKIYAVGLVKVARPNAIENPRIFLKFFLLKNRVRNKHQIETIIVTKRSF